LQGLQGLHGLHGFFAAQGLHGFFAAQGLQGFAAAQGLHGFFAAQGLHGVFAAHVAICTDVSAALATATGRAAAPVAKVATLRATKVFLNIQASKENEAG
jgi:uncharacterized membrane protein YphA (DoxX/SURF4 family)